MDTARSQDSRTPARAAAALVALVALWQLADAGAFGLGTDEAHYALYATHLDTGYFDHPPMVGWLQAAALQLGDGERVLRLVPILLGVLSGATLYRLARRMFPAASAWRALLALGLVEATAAFHVISWWMLPEGPLLLLALLVAGRLLTLARREDTPATWLALGLLLGLAGLSKYTAVTLAAGTILVALLRRPARLRGPWPWVAVALAALVVAPVVLWNAHHDWISFAYQIGHGTGGSEWRWSRFFKGQAGQLLAYGPLLFCGTWLVLLAPPGRLREALRDPARLVTLAVAGPVLALFALSGGKKATLPHWTATAFVIAAPLVAQWVADGWTRRARRALAAVSALLAVAMIGGAHLLARFPALPLPVDVDPTVAVRAWPQAASRARALLSEVESTPGPPARLFVDHWTSASRLAWYARPAAVLPLDTRVDQFDLWFGSPAAGDRGVLMVWEDEPPGPGAPETPKDLARFGQVTPREPLEVLRDGRVVATFRFWLVAGYMPPAPRAGTAPR